MSAVMPLVRTQIRRMTGDDLDEVVEIEASAYEFPWSMGIFCDCLRVGYECRVLLANERLVAYGILSTLAHEAHVLNLCVSPDVRREGFAHLLLRNLLGISADKDVGEVFLEVRPSNIGALRLYRSFGFEQIGVRQNYYRADSGREDALVMCARVDRFSAADLAPTLNHHTLN